MTSNRSIPVVLMIALLMGAAVATAQDEPAQEPNEMDALQRELELQERTLRELRARLDRLAGKPLEEEPATTRRPGEAPSPAEEAEAKMARTYGRRSPVGYRSSFNDRQSAAARPSDLVLDPEYRGFMPIGETIFMIKFNPKPRVDLTVDTQNSGNDFRFVTARIPVEGEAGRGGGLNVNMNGNGSQLRLDIRAPTADGNFRLYYQNDFFGSDTQHFQYRLQHFYGQYYGVLAGFTYGVFENPDAWPDTVDYEGPNSVIFARRAVFHYTFALADELNMTVGVEDPDAFLDTTGDPDGELRTRMPDTGFNVRWESAKYGHTQFSTIFRSIGINGDTVDDDDVFGWGVNLSGVFPLTESDRIGYWVVYGHGIGGMGNDTSFEDSDAALESDGDLKALEYASSLISYSHDWNPRWRSTATYGFVNLGNASGQDDDAYDQTHYASLNLIYQVFKRLSVGVEALYGHKHDKGGADGEVFRMQMGMVYSLFD